LYFCEYKYCSFNVSSSYFFFCILCVKACNELVDNVDLIPKAFIAAAAAAAGVAGGGDDVAGSVTGSVTGSGISRGDEDVVIELRGDDADDADDAAELRGDGVAGVDEDVCDDADNDVPRPSSSVPSSSFLRQLFKKLFNP
jgi:hypothetical protein